MEKTTYTTVKSVETISVLPRTLTIAPEQMKLTGVDATMFVVYGKDPADRKIWVATFIDEQEAESWVQASKVFGRPVMGAVLAGQGEMIKGGEMSDDAMAIGNEDSGQTGKPS
jgi:hypothetical protein